MVTPFLSPSVRDTSNRFNSNLSVGMTPNIPHQWGEDVLKALALEIHKIRISDRLPKPKLSVEFELIQRILPLEQRKPYNTRAYWYTKIKPFLDVIETEYLVELRQKKIAAFTEQKLIAEVSQRPDYSTMVVALKEVLAVQVKELKTWISVELQKLFTLQNAVTDAQLADFLKKIETLPLPRPTPPLLSDTTLPVTPSKPVCITALFYGTTLGTSPFFREQLTAKFPYTELVYHTPGSDLDKQCSSADVIFYTKRLTSDSMLRRMSLFKKPSTKLLALPKDEFNYQKCIQDFIDSLPG